MELRNKKVNFLGDSITEGCKTSSENHRFTGILAQEYSLLARNYGIGGTRYARQMSASENPLHDLDFCGRVAGMDPDADIVVVFGGTNDYGHGDAPFGTLSDRSAETFCGACHELYSSLIEKYPHASIVIITPLHRSEEDNPYGDGTIKTQRPPLWEYVDAIRKVAAHYGLSVLDLYAQGVLDPHEPAVLEALVQDGLHPNDGGHVILAEAIAKHILSL